MVWTRVGTHGARRWRSVVVLRHHARGRSITAWTPSRGLHGAASTFPRTPIKDLMSIPKPREHDAVADAPVTTVCGWVKTIRRQKNLSFITINDGSSFQSLQVVCDASSICAESLADVSVGSSVTVTGVVSHAPKSGQVEVNAQSVAVLGPSDPATYPLSKKYHSLEFVREHLHLRPRTNTFGAVTRVRNALSQGLHQYFQSQGFVQVHTPILTSIDAEGAGEQFRVVRDTESPSADGTDGHFFGLPAYLTVSGQLHAEMYASALSNVYTFGPTFRAENSNTSRHLSEFWMVEPEMAFAGLDECMASAQGAVQRSIQHALETCPDDVSFFHAQYAKAEKGNLLGQLQSILDRDIPHITYTEAIAILDKAPVAFEVPPEWGMDLKTEHERYLAEKHVGGPVFVTDYPAALKAFYMRQNDVDDPARATVAGMDLLVPTVGELVGGSVREERLHVLEAKMRASGVDPAGLQWYLDLRRFGTVPHAGWGLGFERLVLFATGMDNIRDAIAVPRYPGACRH
ncbi:asparagine-tRNA ligase, variant [Aphanomyces invadans]|uniref:asparagine--tRNA ligase n=1 Tax=Aphanomyces invadans TaxID=157072 RepID=A0A024UIT1_9STRA|nr:asparagine-tRNA ligase, variant [Aphanomyces invadans]ETW06341.1 asparagine-tRNA ligase, variant [Aphanomyces invadans]|eukprot:XP_008864416.1 asparagine-tRNA ligase, variant [Aphanomyces invadans]